jgi:hypothetical protein
LGTWPNRAFEGRLRLLFMAEQQVAKYWDGIGAVAAAL